MNGRLLVSGLACAACLSIPERDIPPFAARPGAELRPMEDAFIAHDGQGGRFDGPFETDDARRPGQTDAEGPANDARPPDPTDADRPPSDAEPASDARPGPTDARPGPDDARPLPLDARPSSDAGCVPAEDVCDGLDNDCNGFPDDDGAGHGLARFCYSGPAGTEGVGACAAGFQRCEGGAWSACRGEVLPAPEDCDGADDDCDGVADDDAPGCECEEGERRACYSGPAGTAGVGRCHTGTQRCDSAIDAFGPCEGEVVPARETCNDTDDDCNGQVDDAVPEAGRPCTREQGPCRSDGRLYCSREQGALLCDAPPPPVNPELCDGLDNDCDGTTDEGPGGGPLAQDCVTGLAGACNRGVTICGGGVFGPCEPFRNDERCDGEDNDCDGEVDEPPADCACRDPGALRECYGGPDGTVGVGICEPGRQLCSMDREWGPCNDAVLPQPERCNNRDDDCDGQLDEDLVGDECARGLGACRVVGREICDRGRYLCDAHGGEPTAERCNGLDDDCDGDTDEDFRDLLFADCFRGEGHCRRAGVMVCDAAGNLTCNAEIVFPELEVCDGVDNDCDGFRDEEFPGFGDGCDTGLSGPCAEGWRDCGVNGQEFCNAPEGFNEHCNGEDDDCDGAFDEGLDGCNPP